MDKNNVYAYQEGNTHRFQTRTPLEGVSGSMVEREEIKTTIASVPSTAPRPMETNDYAQPQPVPNMYQPNVSNPRNMSTIGVEGDGGGAKRTTSGPYIKSDATSPVYVAYSPVSPASDYPGFIQGIFSILFAIVSVIFIPVFFGPMAVVLGLQALSRGALTVGLVGLIVSSVSMIFQVGVLLFH